MSQDRYTRSARGQPCQVRVPGICTPAPENNTTVLAHINGFRAGRKALNIHAAYACHACHTWLDYGWAQSDATRQQRDTYHYEAMLRTQIIMVADGVLKL